jgi:hypothetical protein
MSHLIAPPTTRVQSPSNENLHHRIRRAVAALDPLSNPTTSPPSNSNRPSQQQQQQQQQQQPDAKESLNVGSSHRSRRKRSLDRRHRHSRDPHHSHSEDRDLKSSFYRRPQLSKMYPSSLSKPGNCIPEIIVENVEQVNPRSTSTTPPLPPNNAPSNHYNPNQPHRKRNHHNPSESSSHQDEDDDDDKGGESPARAINGDCRTEATTQQVRRAIAMFSSAQASQLQRLKRLMMAIFILSATFACTTVYLVKKGLDQTQFEDGYHSLSIQIMDQWRQRVIQTYMAMDVFVTDVVSVSQLSFVQPSLGIVSTSWPYVTLPDYAHRAQKFQTMNPATVHMGQYHVVQPDEREAWETYTATSSGWVGQSIQIQNGEDSSSSTLAQAQEVSASLPAFIHDYQGDTVPVGSDLLLPMWQSSPILITDPSIPNVYNLDGQASTLTEESVSQLMLRRVVLGPVRNLGVLPEGEPQGDAATTDTDLSRVVAAELGPQAMATNEWLQRLLLGTDREGTYAEPISDVYYPIVRNSDQSQVVGIFSMTIQWRAFLQSLLPFSVLGMEDSGTGGDIDIVVTNSCGQTFTYRVHSDHDDAAAAAGFESETMQYLGPGDHHEVAFDGWETSIKVHEILAESSYAGWPLTDETCPYTVLFYPTQTLQGAFATNNAMPLTAGTATLFLFAGTVILLYDFLIRISSRGT